jgi:DMSO reductase family type II enzyme heme b subunit
MTPSVEFIKSDASVKEAALKMEELDVGVLPVVIGSDAVGIVTDRDIVIRSVAQGLDPEKTPIKEMGTKDFPTNGWYWRPDFDEKPMNQVAHGLATSLYTKEASIVSNSKWENGMWKVVIARSLKVKEEAVNFTPGMKTVIGFAAWEGGNGERGGVKAFSKEWREFELKA